MSHFDSSLLPHHHQVHFTLRAIAFTCRRQLQQKGIRCQHLHLHHAVMSPNNMIFAAAALLAAVAFTCEIARRSSSLTSPPKDAPPQPQLCSDGLPYEPHLSLAEFKAKYKVA